MQMHSFSCDISSGFVNPGSISLFLFHNAMHDLTGSFYVMLSQLF